MSVNPRCFALSQISFLVTSITKKNYKYNSAEIASLIEKHGAEAEKYLFRCLLSQVDFSSTDGRNSSKDGQQLQLLAQEANAVITRPNFVAVLCYGFENQENKSLRPISQALPLFAKTLRLARVQEVVIALGLTHSSDPDLRAHAFQHLKAKLPEVVRSYSDLSSGLEGGLRDVAIEVLHLLLSYLLQNPEEEVGVTRENIDAFVQVLRRDFPREHVPVVLAPLLYREEQDITEDRLVPVSVSLPSSVTSLNLADIIRDVGYIATASKQDALEILKDYGRNLITPGTVARVLGMMAQTHTGLPESVPYLGVTGDASRMQTKSPMTWDAKVFATALQALVPNLCWRDVVPELDYNGFYLPSPEGLSIIMTAFNVSCRDPFPIEMIYGAWVHSMGQLSWFQQTLSGCPDFSFANYPFDPVSLEPLKNTFSGEEAKTWRSLNLIETLLDLAEKGHYAEVMALFKVPMKQCPEVLFLGLLQCKTSWQVMQQELISTLLPFFLTNSNAIPILNYAWHSQISNSVVQSMLMQAMSSWYMLGDTPDQGRLIRILDIAQDLKILPMMLKGNQFPFVIDLACRASKREFLKLDIWMVEKIKEHQEPFIKECINFLAHRAPKPIVPTSTDRSGLTHDTVATMLACLQPFNASLKPDSAEKLRMLVNIHEPITPPMRIPVGPLMINSNTGQMDVSMLQGLTPTGFPSPGLGSPGSPGKSNISLASSLGQSAFGSIGGGDPLQAALGMAVGGGSVPTQQTPVKQSAMDLLLYSDQQQFSRDVDEKANAYFQAIYNRGMSVDRLLDILKQFKDSANKKERDLFVCMLRNMFEEYKFFPQFPEKELQITGQLFGGIIEQGLVTYMSLSLALRYVLDALKKGSSTKMHLFGLAALDKFRKRIKDFPQYCSNIASIPHFHQFPVHLRQYVQYGQQGMEPPPSILGLGFQDASATNPGGGIPMGLGSSGQPSLPPLPTLNTNIASFQQATSSSPLHSPVTHSPGSGQLSPTVSVGSKPGAESPIGSRKDAPSINNTNIDTLLVAADQSGEKKQPPDELQDKIHFLFNNLSASTLQQKVDEFSELVSEDLYEWVAQYLVVKRASIEPNFHPLYMSFMNTHNNTVLNNAVCRETYRNIKVILQSDKSSNSFSDRSILKNLGRWLGMQTLAKNKPILHVDLAVKDLLLEAYHRGQQDLLYVVPFVAKVLESCADGKVFKPPNPWVMAIMAVLAELHAVPELKLNLKFEVEVLCKHLQIDLMEIPQSNVLGDTERIKRACQLSSQKDKQPGAVAGSSSPPPPTYRPDDIPLLLSGLGPLIQVNPQIILLQQYPNLKQYVQPSIEKAVKDLLAPVVERSAKIALTTTEHIIRKDFALDPEIGHMHAAAMHMVRHLTAGMAMITCREPLLVSISSNLKTAFIAMLRHPGDESLKQMIETAAHQISADNTELACAFIQKTAIEKVVPEVEKRLNEEFEMRQLARSERRQYYNPVSLTYQADSMPEMLRINVGAPTPQQAAVYEEFARCLPGFLPSSTKQPEAITMYVKPDTIQQFVPTDEFMLLMNNCIKELGVQIRQVPAPMGSHHVTLMRSLVEVAMQLRMGPTYTNVISLLQKALEGLLEGMNPPPNDPDLFVSFRDCHIFILRALQDSRALGPMASCRLVSKMLLETREDIKYSPRALILLIGLQLVDMRQLDEFLAKAVENGRNLVALSCSIKLVNAIVSAEKRETPITDNELKKTKDTLFRLAANIGQLPESTAQLLEPFCREHGISMPTTLSGELDRAPGGHPSMMHQNVGGLTHNLEDPPGLYEKVEFLLSEWVRHFHQPGLMRDGDKVYAAYVSRLQQQGILKNDDLIQRFFRISMEMCVELCYRTLADTGSLNVGMMRPKCYHTMDAFVKLVVVLVRYSGDPTNTVTRINLLNKVLNMVVQVLIKDLETRGTEFHQLAYHRFFIMLLSDLTAPDPVFDAISYPVMQCFSAAYHNVRPSKAPGFAYAWLELISHRIFIAKLLMQQTPQQKGWVMFHQLLIDLFKFLSPFLRNAELTKPTQLLYKGTLRVLLVLLHDFPEFLCDYHFSFCDVIPPNCIQMRNLILSAFPRSMRLPDPFTPNLKVEMLPDIQTAPRILPPFVQHIPASLKKDLDNYIKSRAPVTLLPELRTHLQVSSDPGKQYNVSVMNALVLYVGTQSITYIHSKGGTPSPSTIAHTAHMDIFQHLVVDLDTEGRYLFLNAIANQLRYPNSHTHYFSCALLSLFSETNHEAIQEQITRVLLERLIVNRPHPWGLLITFIELIKNQSYNFWKHEFVHCAPEIEKLFDSVARSCKQPQTASNREETHE